MTATAVTAIKASATGRLSLWRGILHQPLGVFSVAVLVLMTIIAIIGPLIAPMDPNTSSLQSILLPPGGEHLLGTDGSGRDVFSRVIVGTRYSLLGALTTLVVSAVIGVTAGLVAAYFRGGLEVTFSYGAALLMALPGMVVLLAARTVLGPNLWLMMIIFGVIISPAFYRLTFAVVSAVRDELYVDAARSVGLSDARIIGRHILTVVRAPVIIQAAGIACVGIGIQAGLELLGLGDRDLVTWGGILNDGFQVLFRQPLLIVWPSIAIVLVTLALTLFANVLRDSLEGTVATRRRKIRNAPRKSQEKNHVAAAPISSAILSVRGLQVSYERPDRSLTTVVHDVNFDVNRGEILGLVGESGSGKTQTAFAILDVLPVGGFISGGAVLINGRHTSPADRASSRGRSLAYIPQEPMSNLDPSFTIGDQLMEPLRRVGKLSRSAAHDGTVALLKRVGIVDPVAVMRSYPHQISGGMAQRVLIAGAVASKPDILIADEPTTALDVTVQAEVLDLLRDLQAERGMAVVLVTHNFGVVADICDRVAVMQAGRVVESGDTDQIFNAPQHDYTKTLLSSILSENTIREPYEQAPEVRA